MKSRTSFFNGTIFRKNLGRFFPLWGGYTLCLILGMLLMMNDNLEYWFAAHLGTMAPAMAVVNFGYALLTAQALFGDLWNTRMCNGLHALPLRRECWFHTQVASGLIFSLIPTVILACSAIPILSVSKVENSWQIPLYFGLACNLEYLFFFAAAAFAALCSGNRAGMTLVYVIANLGSYFAYFLVGTLITPMYYGAITPQYVFMRLCPVIQICNSSLIECERHEISAGLSASGQELREIHGNFWLGDGWLYLGIVALTGLVLLVLAKGMYRRRNLECAGDFLATDKLAPVFMVLFSLTVGVVFQFVPEALVITDFAFPVFLYIGVTVGWFTGRMLLERQVNVFRRGKTWLGLFLMLAILAGSLYGLSLDPFGIEDWVPDPADIKQATITNGYRGTAELKTAEDLETLVQIHQGILEEKLTREETDLEWQKAVDAARKTPEVISGAMGLSEMADKIGCRRYTSVRMEYLLNNGHTVARDYLMWVDSEAAQLAKPIFNRVSAIFYHYFDIQEEADLRKLVRAPERMHVGYVSLPQEYLTAETVAGLVEAVLADCKEGTMVQTSAYHDGFVIDSGKNYLNEYRVELSFLEEELYFSIYADSRNCLAWMEETGIRDYVDAQLANSLG